MMARARSSLRRRRNDPRDIGVSLIEVLVVISILALILSMLLPSLQGAREQVRRILCANNLQQWGKALHYYREDSNDFIPTEGTTTAWSMRGTWYNELPPYLGLPPYKDTPGVAEAIEVLPAIDVRICPSKNRTKAFKSTSGKNQFHYGMNLVLDGVGSPAPSRDTPGFADEGSDPLRASRFLGHPMTVYLFDISPNSPRGSPRDIATMHQRGWDGEPVAEFHGDFANLLYLNGGVTNCMTDDLVTGRDFRHGAIHWNHPRLYWGYLPRSD